MLVGQSISQSVSYFPRFSAPAHLFVMVRGVLDLCIDPVRCMENMLEMSAKHRLGPVTGLDTRHNSRRQLGMGSNATSPTGQRCVLAVSLRVLNYARNVCDTWRGRWMNRQTDCLNF